MSYRPLTSKELSALRLGDPVTVALPGGEILPCAFRYFVAGGIAGDTFARLLAKGKLIAADPERLLTPEGEARGD